MKVNYNLDDINFKDGTVIIAGAGPGELKLTTLNVFLSVKKADVIIYDSLVNTELLRENKKNAKKIFAGKTQSNKACTQNEINQWLVDFARKKKKVLRLKGGDVSFFSRGSQEINFLKKNKIKYKIFSGITSAQSAIKEIFRNEFNSSNCLNFITGHKIIKPNKRDINYKYLVNNKGKIIVYMGIGQAEFISQKLINEGLKKNTRVSIISNASLPNQKIFNTILCNCSRTIKDHEILPPSIIVIN